MSPVDAKLSKSAMAQTANNPLLRTAIVTLTDQRYNTFARRACGLRVGSLNAAAFPGLGDNFYSFVVKDQWGYHYIIDVKKGGYTEIELKEIEAAWNNK